MAKFTSDTIEKVRAAADMVEIVSAQTDLKRAGGGRYMGLCPFHEERSPSFSVNATDKLYHCFGCGVGGDLFEFVMSTQNLDFPDAVESLAERYGVEVTREQEDPRAEQRRQQKARLTELMDRAAGFYANFFQTADEAGKAREYLAGRGLSAELLKDFGVGYAPSAWDTLLMRSQRAGFKVAELERAGLAQKGRGGGFYDRFRERITFPIRDARGRTLGFGARAMRDQQGAKYINTAENELFHKSEILYGIDRARPAMAKADRAILVEGYTDVIALHQVGLTESVGIMGTALTEQQVAQLSAVVNTVVLALDADAAGQKAMLRAQEVAAGRRLEILVAAMPEGVDPAEMVIAEGGADRFRELVEGAIELAEFQVDLILAGVDTTSPRDRDRGLAEAAPVLAQLPPGATRQELVRRVTERLQIDSSVVLARVEEPAEKSQVRALADVETQPVKPTVLSRRERTERWLLAMCVAQPDEGRQWLEKLDARHLSSPLMERTVEWLKGHLDDPAAGLDPQDRELQKMVAALVARADPDLVGTGSIRRNYTELELAALEDEIAEAARSGDAAGRVELQRRRSELVEQLRKAAADEPAA
ncbi:MAG: DNA primase [Solirubrobacterales bacterium]|nr:DNA primase [Solirubrobacterales bacterium]OJU94123.1 MAG: DNA primase [Solirubrobacterales bacterium 67-14]